MYYRIHVNGRLSDDWSDWFGALAMTCLPNGTTVLAGDLPDQAALLGILNRLHAVNLRLLAVLSAEYAPAESSTAGDTPV
ncbi:MAG: hypothetical protein IT324_02325 [Anaerolineae bacterium]|nr:hypothetical protein [Anaerolineae bacterium]